MELTLPTGSAPAPTERTDVLGPVLSLYADEASRALTRDGSPVRHTYVSPSPVVHDRCCDGMVYSRLVSVVPQIGTPGTASPDTAAPCGVMGFTVHLGVGVLRCAATVDSRGNPPRASAVTRDGLSQVDDLQSLRDAILGLPGTRSLGNWSPIAPEGGCFGGEWICTVRVDNLMVPVPEPEASQ